MSSGSSEYASCVTGPTSGPVYPGGSNYTNFWKAVCLAIAENPLNNLYQTAEAAYVNATFLPTLGIHSYGCNTISVATYAQLSSALYTNASSGWWNISQVLGNYTNVYSQQWVFLNYTTTNTTTGATLWSNYTARAVTATRLLFLNPNEKAAYYTAFNDSNGAALTGGNTYQINVTGGKIPLAPQGFWSFTVYGNNYYLLTNPSNKWAVQGNASTLPPATFNLSSSCSTPNCIPIPSTATTFNVMFRAYSPTSAILPVNGVVSYTLPNISKCTTPCN